MNTRSIASITTSARRRCRTSWCCASPMACSNRSGIAITSIMSRSSSMNSSASATAAVSMPQPAHCATWCRTICSNCCRWLGWSLQSVSMRIRSARRRARGWRRSRFKVKRRHSTTETFVALKLMIDNWRWAGVPFYLRTGKALASKRTEVAIKFKQAPFAMFRCTPVDRLSQNYLVISIEPTEGITLQFNTKVPGPTITIDGVEMKFRYKDYFKAEPSTGYETLIYDCMIGDNILFQRADGVEAGWQAVQPFLDAWKKAGAKGLEYYKAGSEGPLGAEELLKRDGRSWRKLS